MVNSQFPRLRMRRLRRHSFSRALVSESALRSDDLIQPLFVHEGEGRREAVPSMPGVDRLTADLVIEKASASPRSGYSSGRVISGRATGKEITDR